MECSKCPVKSLCDVGIKPESCNNIRTTGNSSKQSADDVMKMFTDFFGKDGNPFGGKKK